jgi:hypothetical protein
MTERLRCGETSANAAAPALLIDEPELSCVRSDAYLNDRIEIHDRLLLMNGVLLPLLGTGVLKQTELRIDTHAQQSFSL